MIRKLLCWLGWHEYILGCAILKETDYCYWREKHNFCEYCDAAVVKCKHCGKVKR